MIKLIMLRDIRGIVNRMAGDIVEYYSWPYEWQGMTEEQRVAEGLYVICFGHGEFEIIKVPDDAKLEG